MSSRKIKPETTFGADVVHALKDFREAVERGETISVRTVKLDLEPRKYSAADVRKLRATLGVSQAVLARLVAVSVELIQHWEQGIRKPTPLACRVLEEIEGEPARWMARLVRSNPMAKPARGATAGTK